jgi:hypothetical protein
VIRRLIRRSGIVVFVAAVAATGITAVALAYSYTVIYGTSGSDSLNAGPTGNLHIYGFQGSDSINGGGGNITVNGSGQPVINGFDLFYGDGQCSQLSQNDDAYCSHPAPWLPQPWTDKSSQSDSINGGVGPDWLIGGGGNDSINGSETYDTIVGGPHNDSLNGGELGSAIIAIYGISSSLSVRTQKTLGVVGYKGLIGVANSVDIYNPSRKSPASVACSGAANKDVVFVNKSDSTSGCYKVYVGVAPCFPDGKTYPSGNPCTGANPPFAFPLPALGGQPFARDANRTARRHRKSHSTHHRRVVRHRSRRHPAS